MVMYNSWPVAFPGSPSPNNLLNYSIGIDRFEADGKIRSLVWHRLALVHATSEPQPPAATSSTAATTCTNRFELSEDICAQFLANFQVLSKSTVLATTDENLR